MSKTLEDIIAAPSLVREQWLPTELAVREVLAFERRFGSKHLMLACHAALPLILTPELLNLIHVNFLDEEQISWVAEVDFLLSPLCRPIDDGLFEVEPSIREVLLVELENQFGFERPFRLAKFLQVYLADKLGVQRCSEVTRTQWWIAQAYLDPDSLVVEMTNLLESSLSEKDNVIGLPEQIQVVTTLEILTEPLERTNRQTEYQYLVNSSRVAAQILYSNKRVLTPRIQQEQAETEYRLVSPNIFRQLADVDVRRNVVSDKEVANLDEFRQFIHGYALLIGAGEMANPMLSLPVTVKDVQTLQSVLTDPELCAYPNNEYHVRLLHSAEVTRRGILEGLDWLKRQAVADPEATVVVYYSGHGAYDSSTNQYYLLQHDSDPSDIENSALSARIFTETLHQIRAKQLLVVLDCSHAEGMVTIQEGEAKLPADFLPTILPKRFADKSKRHEGWAVFAGCLQNQMSWSRQDGTMSIYTYHLIEALKGAGNQPGDKVVRISNLMNYLAKMVPESARTMHQCEQTPFFDCGTEDFAVALLRGGKGLPASSQERGLPQIMSNQEQESLLQQRKQIQRAEREDTFTLDPIDLTNLPAHVVVKARAIIAGLQNQQNYREYGGKRLRHNRWIISIPVTRNYRMICHDRGDIVVPQAVLSHEDYTKSIQNKFKAIEKSKI